MRIDEICLATQQIQVEWTQFDWQTGLSRRVQQGIELVRFHSVSATTTWIYSVLLDFQKTPFGCPTRLVEITFRAELEYLDFQNMFNSICANRLEQSQFRWSHSFWIVPRFQCETKIRIDRGWKRVAYGGSGAKLRLPCAPVPLQSTMLLCLVVRLDSCIGLW